MFGGDEASLSVVSKFVQIMVDKEEVVLTYHSHSS